MASPGSREPRGGPGGTSPPDGTAGGRPPGLAPVMTVIRSRERQGLECCPVVAWQAKPAPWPHRIKSMRMSRRDGRRAGLGAIAGLLAAGTALGVGQFVAGLTGASGSPVVAVGETAAATRPTATVTSLLPTLAATAAAVAVLRMLIPLVGPPALTAARPAVSFDPVTAADPAVEAGPEAEDLEPTQPGRRSFLAAGAVTAGIAAGAGLAGRLLAERSSVASARRSLRIPKPAGTVPALPSGVNFDIPGLTPFVTSNTSFYRVDTALVLPQVDPSSWQLRIGGMVDREITLTFDELLKRPLIEDYVTLCCVSNPVGGPYIGNAKWLGASLAAVLREAGIKAGADQL